MTKDEVKGVLESSLIKYHKLMDESLSSYRITCDGALNAIRYESAMNAIVEIADKLCIDLLVEETSKYADRISKLPD